MSPVAIDTKQTELTFYKIFEFIFYFLLCIRKMNNFLDAGEYEICWRKVGSFVWQFLFAVAVAYFSTISIFPSPTLSLHFCKIEFSAINSIYFRVPMESVILILPRDVS